uniref:Integrase catalytic domain-containing protein n=1 Tax=Fagus sylvatica TaxID=28930 RepID=A0A2N9HUM1_FAGSY
MNVLNNSWLLDSTCSFHVTIHMSWFDTYRSVNCGSIRMGNDASCKVIGIGTIKIKMFDNVVRTLGEVRHVPEMKKNLISLGTLDSKGYSYKSEHGIMNVSKGAMVVMRGQRINDNIYKLLGSTILGGVAIVFESEDDDTLLWHMRLGHMNEHGMRELHKRNLLVGIRSCKLDFCKYCVMGKQCRVRFKTATHNTKGKLDYVHSDIWGPVRVSSKGGAQYFMSFIDDYSRKVWVYFLKNKFDAFATFKKWKAKVENHTGRKLNCLRTDNGTEYRDGEFLKFCEEHGIKRHFTVQKTPQQNGVTERLNRTITETARYRSKLDPKSKKCIFLGYEKGVKGYKLWDLVAQKMVISRDVVFDEKSMTKAFREDKYQAAESNNSNSRSTVQVELDELESHPEEESHNSDEELDITRSEKPKRNKRPLIMYGFEDLVSYALLTKLPKGKKPIGCKWVFKKKEAVSEKEGERFKARLVVKGYSQRHGIDYDEVFSPVIRHTSIRAVLALVANQDLELEQLDVKTRSFMGIWRKKFSWYNQKGSRKPDMLRVPNASTVGCLKYAMVCTRPDLVHAVSTISRQSGTNSIIVYVDANYTSDVDDRRSTTGYLFTLLGGPICWKSTLQSIVAMSTIEAEYMAVAEAAKEALSLKGLGKELGLNQVGVQMHCDSQSAIYLTKNQVYHARTKHIDVRFHKIRELIVRGDIVLEKVHTSENAVDMLTKPIMIAKSKHCLELINVCSL